MKEKLNELHLFAGAGGGILGGMLLGHTTVCAVELEPYCRKVLLQRQRDGILPKFPIWDDVCTFDGTPWRGKVDVVCGGFPCQDISAAGKGAGITGERSGLWGEMARIIGEIRPKYAFVENSPMLTLRGLDRVLGDLSEMGYDARWGVVGASHVGAPHRRERIWILAYSRSICSQNRCEQFGVFKTKKADWKTTWNLRRDNFTQQWWWDCEPQLDRVVNGVANRVDRMRCIGNGQVSIVAATAFKILKGK
jgi:DNA (cytosine-5)-methyltransferase 1